MDTHPRTPQLPPLVLRLRPAGSLGIQDGALVLTRPGTRTRIPLKAIETVTVDPDGQALEIVLTPGDTAPGTVYRCGSRNTAAVATFAETVNSALPLRDPDAPRTHGDALVETERVSGSPGPRDLHWLARLAAVVLVFGAGATLVHLRGPHEESALLWLLGIIPLGISWAASELIGQLWLRLRLRNRGITVMGAVREYVSGPGAGYRYRFTDLRGTEHTAPLGYELGRFEKGPETMAVTYDPDRPDRAATVLPVAKVVGKVATVVLLGLPAFALTGYAYGYQLVAALFL
ncbi:hypothetical protein ABT354_11960 [Streptomyces sp. NPDC000594]|uniref:hypothetical protein n=1 Tax=Streptomyces sp. NPDC000594 TaxID=3154261 RepID=UPI003331DB27